MSQVALLSEYLSSATECEPLVLTRLLRGAEGSAFAGDADALVDGLVSALDAQLATQLDLVLGHPKLQRFETTWRGLHTVVMRLPRDRELRVEILNCSLEDLEADFDDAPDILKSGLFKLVYSGEYGPFGGRPYAAVVCHERFEPEDLRLLRSCALVAQLAALQFIGQAGDKLLDMALADPPPHPTTQWDPPSRWGAFRRGEESRFVSLVAGRWLARAPERHDACAERPWPFRESVAALRYASGALLVALSFARSFVAYRTPIHAFGPVDGSVAELPRHEGRSTCGSAPSELVRRLDACGFIPLVERAPGLVELAGDSTCLEISHSFGRYLDEPGRSLHARLPATLFAERFVQYFKVLHREQIGTWLTCEETKDALSAWLQAYVSEGAGSPARLLRGFELSMAESRPDPANWRLGVKLEPEGWAGGQGCQIKIDARIDRD
jgi:type VI secretion system protein ImpC